VSRRDRKDEYHEFRVKAFKYRSPKAYLFEIAGADEPVWVPISQCDYDEDSGIVQISDWLVKQKPELAKALDDPRARD
jgi:hypothetical protein